MSSATNPEPRLLLTTETTFFGDPMLRLEIRPVYLSDDGEVRNYVDSSFDQEPLADLMISAQADLITGNPTYGWRVEYRDVYSADLRRVESMRKMLRKIARELDKWDAQLGTADTFGAYVARVSTAIGAGAYGIRTDEIRADGSHYLWTDATGFSWQLDRIVKEFRDKHAPAVV